MLEVPPIFRRLEAALLAIALSLAVVACGGSGYKPAKREFTASDQARAKRVVPRLLDFPAGWIPAKIEEDRGSWFSRVFKCELDLSDLTETGRAESRFEGPEVMARPGVVTTVIVFQNTVQARIFVERITSRSSMRCLSNDIIGWYREHGTEAKPTDSHWRSPTAGRGWPNRNVRAFRLSKQGHEFGAWYEEFFIRRGRSVADVLVGTWITNPVFEALDRVESSLGKTLTERMASSG